MRMVLPLKRRHRQFLIMLKCINRKAFLFHTTSMFKGDKRIKSQLRVTAQETGANQCWQG
jgi:hypothetical protein